MKSYMERVIAELPQFMAHFSQGLFRPRQFIHQQIAPALKGDETSKGIEFLILSFLIALFVSQILPEAVNPMTLPASEEAFTRLASTALYQLFLLFFSAAIIFGCLRLFGIAGSFAGFFRVFAFFCGISLVLMVFADAVTNIMFIDPVIAKSWIKLEQNAQALKQLTTQMLCSTGDAGEIAKDPAVAKQFKQQLAAGQALYAKATERTLFMLGSGLQALVYLAMIIWLTVAWFAYGRYHQIAAGKIMLTAILSLVLIWGASFLLSTMQTGGEMMALYRACPAA